MDEPVRSRGSGTSIEDPFRLEPMHPAAGELFEMQIISEVFGEKNQDWFHHQRLSHPNSICEWQIRLHSGQIRKMFFDESRFTYSIPLPDIAQEILENAAAKRPVPDATLISRFPLIEVRAKTAADAGRIVLTHVNEAQSQGWTTGKMYFFVDGWRFDQELFRGSEKTVMMFDMRPARVNAAGTDIISFCACGSFEAIDQVERRMKEANAAKGPFAARHLKFNWKPIARFGSITAGVAGVIALVVSQSVVTAVEIALVAFVLMIAWMACEALRLANASPEVMCKEHLRLEYSSLLRDLYPRRSILGEYIQHIEGTPGDVTRWKSFTDDGMITAESLKRLKRSFEDWLERSPY